MGKGETAGISLAWSRGRRKPHLLMHQGMQGVGEERILPGLLAAPQHSTQASGEDRATTWISNTRPLASACLPFHTGVPSAPSSWNLCLSQNWLCCYRPG